MSRIPECPVCGSNRERKTNPAGQHQCGTCKHIWTPGAKPAPAPAAEGEPEEAERLPAPRPAQPRENAAKQIRSLTAHIEKRLELNGDVRELALDIHQAMADALASGSIQAGIDALEVEE